VEVILRGNAEGVGDAIEERKHRGDVHRFSDLIFGPTCIAHFLNVGVRRARGGVGDKFDVGQQGALGGSQARFIEIAFKNRRYTLIAGSLNTQEVGMAVESIRTTVQERNVARDHFLVAADEMACGEVNCIGEVDHLLEEIGASAETFDDAGNFLAARVRAPVIVGSGRFALSLGIFRDADFRGLRVRVVIP
jgi:hypothetical protein